MTPLERVDIELVEENATIKVAGNAETFWVDARYVLRNPKGPKTLLFGVPMLRDVQFINGDAGVRIDVAGKAVACTLRSTVDLKGNLRPLGDLQAYDTPKSWCVASITIPQGDRVPLRLRYKDSTNFEDNEFTEARLGDHHDRRLVYDVYPAGYWGGPDAHVAIAVDVSALPGVPITPSPKPTTVTPEKVEWQLRGRDLRQLQRLEIAFNMAAALYQRDMLKINKGIRKPRARASSVLMETGDGHAPLLVADGKGGTAWCEGGEGNSAGQWIELAFKPETGSFDEGKDRACNLDGFGIVPGWARVRSYTRYGRVRRFRLSACGGSDPGADFQIKQPTDNPERSAVTPFDFELSESLRSQLYDCVRLTILEAIPGADSPRACIGEIIPIFNCESPGEPIKRRKPPF